MFDMVTANLEQPDLARVSAPEGAGALTNWRSWVGACYFEARGIVNGVLAGTVM
jgi:hypothetical protein